MLLYRSILEPVRASQMEKIVKMLRLHEGEVKTNGRHLAYRCPAGYWTIGIGRNIDPENGIGLSDDEVDYLLSNDVTRVVKELGSAFTWFSDLDEVRRDALIDICFNIGLPRLKGFEKALASMAEGSYDTASLHFLDSRWATQVGERSQRLATMIKTGKYPDELL